MLPVAGKRLCWAALFLPRGAAVPRARPGRATAPFAPRNVPLEEDRLRPWKPDS
jgi:hypothetical protein